MSDIETSPAKTSAPKAKKVTKPKTAPAHPPVAEMVPAAIGALAEKKGSSLAAIKKYIAGHYKVDMDRLAIFIRRYLKSAVESKKLIQTKGSGATGSFKLNKEDKPKKEKKTKAVKPKKPAPKKTTKATPKKTAKKTAAKKTPKKAAKKTPVKKATKAKTVKPAKKATPKKAPAKPKAKKPAAKKSAKK